jgi:hypothetical protein
MTREDLNQLQALDFEMGDVADLWEDVLNECFNINTTQPGLRGIL